MATSLSYSLSFSTRLKASTGALARTCGCLGSYDALCVLMLSLVSTLPQHGVQRDVGHYSKCKLLCFDKASFDDQF